MLGPMDKPDKPAPLEDTRASDADRDQAVARLRAHCAEGRLTLDEFSERTEVALSARTVGELRTVMKDLPADEPQVPAAAPPRRPTGWSVALLGSSSHRGRWRPRANLKVVSLLGSSTLDFRQAEMDVPELRVTVVSVLGSADLLVPEGIEVELTGVPVLGDKSMRLADVDPIPGAPRIRVRAFPLLGSVSVRSKRSRPRPRPAAG
jgi:hypothetical protein